MKVRPFTFESSVLGPILQASCSTSMHPGKMSSFMYLFIWDVPLNCSYACFLFVSATLWSARKGSTYRITGLWSECFQDLCRIWRFRRFFVRHGYSLKRTESGSLISCPCGLILSYLLQEIRSSVTQYRQHMHAHVSISGKSKHSISFCSYLQLSLPGLVLGWMKSQVLHQILKCHISPLGVGAQAAQSLNKPPPLKIHSTVV